MSCLTFKIFPGFRQLKLPSRQPVHYRAPLVVLCHSSHLLRSSHQLEASDCRLTCRTKPLWAPAVVMAAAVLSSSSSSSGSRLQHQLPLTLMTAGAAGLSHSNMQTDGLLLEHRQSRFLKPAAGAATAGRATAPSTPTGRTSSPPHHPNASRCSICVFCSWTVHVCTRFLLESVA